MKKIILVLAIAIMLAIGSLTTISKVREFIEDRKVVTVTETRLLDGSGKVTHYKENRLIGSHDYSEREMCKYCH